MLKALELSGFKSFADKTRFEFPAGITVVVGPNGSGKSNVVDAIKWVLGEQSAKSLRGKDMADVIFKGSGGSGRKPLNTAQATIVFDNSENRLAIDSPEVHVTRRVFRSGEGEYLINEEPCRLKDIKDLFRGTGVGTDAYSLIEQGKVDRLLQASPKDRRAIFEEAAGISRFKAKKIEAQRRLARVEQNLLRLSDIVDEVENRFRSVRNQAGKAKRYREYSGRLKDLRTQVGLTDWRRLTQELTSLTEELEQLRQTQELATQEHRQWEAEADELESQVGAAHAQIRSQETVASKNREQIASLESSIHHERSTQQEFTRQENRYRNQLSAMTTRAGDLQQRVQVTAESLATAEHEHAEVSQGLAAAEEAMQTLDTELQQLRATLKSRRAEHVQLLQTSARYSNDVAALESQVESLDKSADDARQQLGDVEAAVAQVQEEIAASNASESTLAKQQAAKTEALNAASEKLDETRRLVSRKQEELAAQQSRHSAVSERTTLLAELERRQEGISEGVSQLLEQARHATTGALRDICGLVADVIQVDLENAPMVDAALGLSAQCVIVDGSELMAALKSGSFKASGRIGFIATQQERRGGLPDPGPLRDVPGVISRVDEMIETVPAYESLMQHLLDTTWAVESLQLAFELADQYPTLRFVTVAGEVVDTNGTILVGPRRTSTGLVSRRSELRALQREKAVMEERIREAHAEIDRLKLNTEQQEAGCKKLQDERQQANELLSDQRVTSRTLLDRSQQLDTQQSRLRTELEEYQQQREAAAEQVGTVQDQLKSSQSRLAEVEQFLGDHDKQLAGIDGRRQQQNQVVTAARIEVVKSEQMVDGLRARLLQFQEDKRERDRTLQQVHAQLDDATERIRQSERSILQATSDLASAYLLKEQLADAIHTETVANEELLVKRKELLRQAEAARQRIRKTDETLHARELAAGQIGHKRESLAERMRDDYGIELAREAEDSTEPIEAREEIESEIDDLRRKINNIGAVNMEALNELEELEDRFNSLSSQFQDLSDAKDALERIIDRINADSRRLFSETLEAIRQNFQNLYRRAFGGGHADIVLEEGVDVLEAGIEIIATPPGKPSFNNSLLSGGEKALTAVALLLGIFEFRPSPFCVLDEVDAPFDEANIGRFVDVLTEFLQWTKFVVVTHSKKTMTAATTLYGVTMQESGVSKKVSVTFEDVSEDGHISQDAIERSGHDDDRGAA
ncbi:MAG: chromosome segregation protein SMC [Blastopirellula sp.]|nr:chromosome segregation protein SMC [Blastopirellula sp.]